MTQKSDRFYIYAKWDNHKSRAKQAELDKIVKAKLAEIKEKFPNCGFNEYYSDRVGNHSYSKLDIVFKQYLYTGCNFGKYDYNNFVSVVREIDALINALPEELKATGTYSTTDYKAPWVQRCESRSLGLVVRRGFANLELDKKVLDRINTRIRSLPDTLESVKIIGEPTEASKVYATLRSLSRSGKLNFASLYAKLMHHHRNTRWMLVMKANDGRMFTYGHSVVDREDLSLGTLFNHERDFKILVAKYVNTKIFGQDMIVLPL